MTALGVDQNEFVRPVSLVGRHVSLAPLSDDHASDLFSASRREDIWAYLPSVWPRTREEMAGWVASSLKAQEAGLRVPFAVIDNASGRAIGSTSFIEPSAEHRRIEIGWTWYDAAYWRTAVNTECKYLLLQRAFEDLRCLRVGLRCDERNIRSQRAIERIGGVKEGTLRKLQILPDGHQRNVVFYSLIDEEWPARRAWFEEQLRR